MRNRWLGAGVLVLMWGFLAAVFADLPAQVPTHWNLQGEIDGWTARWPGAFIAPAAATLVYLLLQAAPWIDPRRGNVARSAEDRMLIVNLAVLFFALIEGVTLGSALGWPVDVTAWMLAGLGLLLAGMGNYLPRVRSNWWIGVRTPWTLDSDAVWRATHRVTGRVFVVGGVVLMAAAILPAGPRGWVALAVLATIAVVPLAYSFLAWRREAAGRTGPRP